MLGLINQADLLDLLADIASGNAQNVAMHIEQMRMQLIDAGNIFDGLSEALHQIALRQILPDLTLNLSQTEAKQLASLASSIDPQTVQLYYQIVVQAREQIKLANTPMQALKCLLRLLAFRPLSNDAVVIEQP